jgi:PKD repeat protein
MSPTNNDLIQFTDMSTDSDGSIVSWYWDFDDGNTSSIQNSSHSFQEKGLYSVSLLVTDDDGDFDSKIIDISVSNFGPNAAFSYLPLNPVKDNPVQFNDESYDNSGGSITSWYWEFGDGTISYLQNPAHSYIANGSYQVNLTVSNNTDEIDTISKVLFVGFINADISLISGWNLITVPVTNNLMASSLAENITGCQMVSWFDGENQTYKTYIVGVPGYDFVIKDGYGLFILVDQINNLNVVGGWISGVTVPLSVGWNMIGWYHDSDTSAGSVAGNISGCQMVSWFDSENQTFKTYIVGVPGYDFTITRGMGLFILVDTASVWHGEG